MNDHINNCVFYVSFRLSVPLLIRVPPNTLFSLAFFLISSHPLPMLPLSPSLSRAFASFSGAHYLHRRRFFVAPSSFVCTKTIHYCRKYGLW